MRIDNSFEVPLPLDQAWRLLLDVPTVAACIPGVKVTEIVDSQTFRGTASIKVGPIQLQLASQARLEDVDQASHRAVIRGEGVDAKGRGQAKSEVSFRLVPNQESTRVEITTELALSGMIAQYGRASGLINEIAKQILTQFSANLSRLIRERAAAATTEGDAVSLRAVAPAQSEPVSASGLIYRAIKSLLARWLARTRARLSVNSNGARR